MRTEATEGADERKGPGHRVGGQRLRASAATEGRAGREVNLLTRQNTCHGSIAIFSIMYSGYQFSVRRGFGGNVNRGKGLK